MTAADVLPLSQEEVSAYLVSVDVVRTLLSRGADPSLRTSAGRMWGTSDAEEIALFPEGTPHWFEPGPDTPPPEPEPEPVAMPKPAGAAPDLAGMDQAKKQQLLNLLSNLQQAQGAAS